MKVAAAGAVLAAALYLVLRFSPYPDLSEFRESFYSPALFSREGELLAVLPLDQGLRRQHLDKESLTDPQINLILNSEDSSFYTHPGVDLPALVRSLYLYLNSGEIISGGSTITMQLARIISLRPAGIRGKLVEIFNALRLETRLGKDEILSLYLSHLPFGSNIEGLESASRYFFSKSARELSREELAILMMIPRRPGSFNPLLYPDENRKAVERTMPRLSGDLNVKKLEASYIILEENTPSWPRIAPHFLNFVSERLTPDDWKRGGNIPTSLSLEIQRTAEAGLRETVASAEEYRISNGAVIVLDNATGRILGYQGSVDFYDDEHQGQIDGVRILRQPGSTLKPFLYALALENGFTVSSVLPDIPMEFGKDEIYVPENYNQRFNGPVRLAVALGSSLNVPAVYLAERIGVEAFRSRLMEAGFDSLANQRSVGVGLALGNGEVRLMELAGAFSLFSRQGQVLPPGFRMDREVPEGTEVFPAEVSNSIRNILSSKQNRILGFGRTSPLDTEFDALFKTGTSNQFNNIWAVGSTGDITAAVWMGNFSGETVIGAPGSSFPARLVVSLLKELRQEDRFERLDGFTSERICSLSGAKAGPHCPYTIYESFPEGTVLKECGWHREGDVYLPALYSPWIESHNLDFRVDRSFSPVRFVQPGDGAVYYLDSTLPASGQSIPVRVTGSEFAELFVNGRKVYEGQAPFSFFYPLAKGNFTLDLNTSRGSDRVKVIVR